MTISITRSAQTGRIEVENSGISSWVSLDEGLVVTSVVLSQDSIYIGFQDSSSEDILELRFSIDYSFSIGGNSITPSSTNSPSSVLHYTEFLAISENGFTVTNTIPVPIFEPTSGEMEIRTNGNMDVDLFSFSYNLKVEANGGAGRDIFLVTNFQTNDVEIRDFSIGNLIHFESGLEIVGFTNSRGEFEITLGNGSTVSVFLGALQEYQVGDGEMMSATAFKEYAQGQEAATDLVVVADTGESSDIATDENNTGFVINGANAGDRSGISVSTAGDVNGDGFDDLIVGAHYANEGGVSYIVFGKSDDSAVELSDIDDGIGGFVIKGLDGLDSGNSVSDAGDVNGDGLSDFIIGVRTFTEYSSTGYIIFGKSDNTLAVELSDIDNGNGGFTINGIEWDTSNERVIGGSGDVNGDGLDDLIIGVPSASEDSSRSGAGYVIFGKTDGSSVALADIKDGIGGFAINGTLAYSEAGFSVNIVGDVNGDGLDDLILGAPFADTDNGIQSGAAYIVFGKRDGETVELSEVVSDNSMGGFVINGIQTDDSSGFSASGAGDVNGDGFDDIVIGAPVVDVNGTNSGASYVVFGKSDGVSIELADIVEDTIDNGFVIHGIRQYDTLGHSVSEAGDVNGDGLDDIIIGAPVFGKYGDINSGASYVIFGKTDGGTVELEDVNNGIGGFVINGVAAGDHSGRSVSAAGDVNGDGFADLLVGASDADLNNNSNSGASYIVFGGQGHLESALVGTASADTLVGDSGANQLIGGRGDDTLLSNGGEDVLRGGAGDDVLTISDTLFASIDGGTGIDTLVVNASINLDLSNIPNNRLSGIEVIDLNDSGSILTLTTDDILSIVGDEAGNVLWVRGNNANILDLSQTGFTASGITDAIDGIIYWIYEPDESLGLDASVRVFVEDCIMVQEARLEIADNQVFSLDDTAMNSDTIGTVVVSSGIASNYSIVYDFSDSGAFEIDASTGEIILVDIDQLDFSNNPEITLRVVAANNSMADDATVIISLSNTLDTVAPELDDTMVSIQEHSAIGTVVYDVNDANTMDDSDRDDIDGSALQYTITGGNTNGVFAINQNTGVITVVDNSRLDFETNNSYTLTVAASDGSNVGTAEITVSLVDIGVTLDDQSVSLENSANNGDVVAILDGIGDSTPRSYSIIGDAPSNNAFEINETTGVITLVDRSQLDFGGDDIALMVRVTNGAMTDDAVINIDLESDPARIGFSVSGAGDLNGDGLDDLIVGAPGTDANGISNSGASYVVFGKIDGRRVVLSDIDDSDNDKGFIINGIASDTYAGLAVSGAGDVNGDGLADVIVGAPWSDSNGNTNSGASYVVFGKRNGEVVELSNVGDDSALDGFVITGVAPHERSGFSVSGAGDVNGDGLDDIVVGAPSNNLSDSLKGASYVVFGKRDGTSVKLSEIGDNDNANGFVVNGASWGDCVGLSVSGAGDVNGDGLADIVVSTRFADPNGLSSGASYVVFGKRSGGIVEASEISKDNNDNGFAINGAAAWEGSSYSVSGAGDVNGDGLDDIIAGTYNKYGSPSSSSYVVFGKSSGDAVELSDIAEDNNDSGFVINRVASDSSGFSVSGAGDINGDGLDDLIIGAPWDDQDSGRSYVVFGKTDGSALELSLIKLGIGGFVINGAAIDDLSGYSVSGAGDVNGDGFADLIIGAPDSDWRGVGAGDSYVIFGGQGVASSALVGTASADTLVGDSGANQLIGGRGDDTLLSNGGADVLRGGAGDDVLTISDTLFASIHGGTGIDTLDVNASINLDLSNIPNNRLSGIEVIDLNDSGSILTLTTDDILSIVGDEAGNELWVRGNNANILDLSQTGFTASGITDEIDGIIYWIYEPDESLGLDASVRVFVEDCIMVMVQEATPEITDNQSGDRGVAISVLVGTANADTLVGDSGANRIIGGQGNDTLLSNGGADVLRGGAGDDVLAISDMLFASIDGGTGIDTLRVDASINVDLSNIPNNRLSGIEVIDLNDSGSVLTLAADDILSIVGNEASNELWVRGNNENTLDLSQTGFTASGITDPIDGIIYWIYESDESLGLDASVRVFVEDCIMVQEESLEITGVPPFVLSPIPLFAETESADTLTGDSGANVLFGGGGNDTLLGNGGEDSLQGGSGDDVLAISDASFASIEGGLGNDTLRFDAPINLDLSMLGNSTISSIENIDLTNDGGNSTLSLGLADVLAISTETTLDNPFTILGDNGDTVNLLGTPNDTDGGIWSRTDSDNSDANDTYSYTSGSDVLATILIDSDIITTGFIV